MDEVNNSELYSVLEAEPMPWWPTAKSNIGTLWEVHVYLIGSLFLLYAAYCIVAEVRNIFFWSRLLPSDLEKIRAQFITRTCPHHIHMAGMCFFGIRGFLLMYDAYGLEHRDSWKWYRFFWYLPAAGLAATSMLTVVLMANTLIMHKVVTPFEPKKKYGIGSFIIFFLDIIFADAFYHDKELNPNWLVFSRLLHSGYYTLVAGMSLAVVIHLKNPKLHDTFFPGGKTPVNKLKRTLKMNLRAKTLYKRFMASCIVFVIKCILLLVLNFQTAVTILTDYRRSYWHWFIVLSIERVLELLDSLTTVVVVQLGIRLTLLNLDMQLAVTDRSKLASDVTMSSTNREEKSNKPDTTFTGTVSQNSVDADIYNMWSSRAFRNNS